MDVLNVLLDNKPRVRPQMTHGVFSDFHRPCHCHAIGFYHQLLDSFLLYCTFYIEIVITLCFFYNNAVVLAFHSLPEGITGTLVALGKPILL